jgi:transposase InsO family protein
MAAHPIVTAKRRRVIEALKEGTPKTEIAAREQISRKTVRRWQARHEEHGEDWLMDRVSRRRPVMPNQTPLEVELAIVDHALAHPEAGSRTIAAALRPEYGVGVTAVYGTLKRRGLETRAKRLEEPRRRSGQTEPDEVERDRLLSKKRHLKAPEPGYLAGADTALVGRLKEAGIVHLAAAIDVHSSYGTAVLAPARNGEMAAAALERLRKELSEEGVTKTDRVLTDNGTEFKGRPSHPFEAFCRRLGAQHRYTKVRHAWTNGKAERFIQTLKDALEGLLRQKYYQTIEDLQADLDQWLVWYNTERPHQGRYNRGRPPLQVIREFQAQQESKAA